MTEPVVLIETPAPGVGLVRINRPDARNALNMEVRRRIVDALNEMTENATFARSC
jgi:enoyl-CoA hydratase/carnithine racemase